MQSERGNRAIIVGSSIAGLTLAYLLSKKMQVTVIEEKSRSGIGEKVCANIVTSSFLNLARELGINSEDLILKKFSTAKFYSKNNCVELPIQDWEINRKKLLSALIQKAQGNGAKFNFETKFLGLERSSRGYRVLFERNGKKKTENADILIGADGALSRVARKSGLWQNRKFWLAIQARVPGLSRKTGRQSYEIFFLKKFGYYAYVFPSKKDFVVGVIAEPKEAKRNFKSFIHFLKVKKCKSEAAIIPRPKVIRKACKNTFITGDAACQVKFTGGGILPAIKSAIALNDLIINKDSKRQGLLEKEMLLHQIIAKALSRMTDPNFDWLFELARKNRFRMAAKSRDEMVKWIFAFVLKNPSLIKFLPKLL